MHKTKKAGKGKRTQIARLKNDLTCTVTVSQVETGFIAKAVVKAGTQNNVIGTFGVLLASLVLQSKKTGTKIFDREKPLQLAIEIAGKSFTIDAKLFVKTRSASQIRRFLIGANYAVANAYMQAKLATNAQQDVYTFTDNLQDENFVKELLSPKFEIAAVAQSLAPSSN